MASLNKITLIGNLTRDPEHRVTARGQSVTDISLALNRRYLVDGEKREEVTYVDIAFWGKGADVLAEYTKKGHSLYVEGRLRLDTWDDKTTGQKRSRLAVTGESFQFLTSKSPPSDPATGAPTPRPPASAHASSSSGAPSPFDPSDEIPF